MNEAIKRLDLAMQRESFSAIEGTLIESDNGGYRAVANNSGMTVHNMKLVLPYDLRFQTSKLYQDNPQGLDDSLISLEINNADKTFILKHKALENERKELLTQENSDSQSKVIDRLTAESIIHVRGVDD